MKLVIGLVAAATTFSTHSSAQTERDLGSHEHGSAVLNIAIEDSLVFLELESPWNNIVGFEHMPSTDKQQGLVDNALALLNQPKLLFSFSGSDCIAKDVDIESAMGAASDEHHDDDHKEEHDDHHDEDAEHKNKHDDHHDEDAEHKDKHDDHHDKDSEHKDEHDDHHDEDAEHKDEHEDHDKDAEGHDDHEGEETHSSLLASFSFECTDTAALSSIDVWILEQWSGFEELDVQIIGPAGQALVELAPGNTVVDLAAVK